MQRLKFTYQIIGPSFKEQSNCQCHHKGRKNIPVAEISSKPILQQGLYTGLQTSLDIFLNKSKNIDTCKNCGANVFCEKNLHVHFFIDVEHAYHSAILNQIGFSDSPTNAVLSEIPTYLQIKDEKYRLIGVISHNGAEKEI